MPHSASLASRLPLGPSSKGRACSPACSPAPRPPLPAPPPPAASPPLPVPVPPTPPAPPLHAAASPPFAAALPESTALLLNASDGAQPPAAWHSVTWPETGEATAAGEALPGIMGACAAGVATAAEGTLPCCAVAAVTAAGPVASALGPLARAPMPAIFSASALSCVHIQQGNYACAFMSACMHLRTCAHTCARLSVHTFGTTSCSRMPKRGCGQHTLHPDCIPQGVQLLHGRHVTRPEVLQPARAHPLRLRPHPSPCPHSHTKLQHLLLRKHPSHAWKALRPGHALPPEATWHIHFHTPRGHMRPPQTLSPLKPLASTGAGAPSPQIHSPEPI